MTDPKWSRPPRFTYANYLDPRSTAPIAVAFSGGPDSFLALRETLAWAAKRPVIALHVDHRLNPASMAWAQRAEDLAGRLGARFRSLVWEGPKPVTGLPAAARIARHQLLAAEARAIGAKVIVTGHNKDDLFENTELGQGRFHEWSPSPVWPHGRGLFLLRPLFWLTRQEIRTQLDREGLLDGLIDDPANHDVRHPRIAVRLRSEPYRARILPADEFEERDLGRLAQAGVQTGAIRLPIGAFDEASFAARRLVLGRAMSAAGGGPRTPRGTAVVALLDRLTSNPEVVGTLAGARIARDGDAWLVTREPGRGGIAPLMLGAGKTGVFDGRYEVTAASSLTVRPLRGLAVRLPKTQQSALRAIPPAARGTLPVIETENSLFCPILALDRATGCRSLVEGRLAAACGAIAHESGL